MQSRVVGDDPVDAAETADADEVAGTDELLMSEAAGERLDASPNVAIAELPELGQKAGTLSGALERALRETGSVGVELEELRDRLDGRRAVMDLVEELGRRRQLEELRVVFPKAQQTPARTLEELLVPDLRFLHRIAIVCRHEHASTNVHLRVKARPEAILSHRSDVTAGLTSRLREASRVCKSELAGWLLTSAVRTEIRFSARARQRRDSFMGPLGAPTATRCGAHR
jgi:hypothetical protein